MLLVFIKYVYGLYSHLLKAFLCHGLPHVHKALITGESSPLDKFLHSTHDSSSSHLHFHEVEAGPTAQCISAKGCRSLAASLAYLVDWVHNFQQAFQTLPGSQPLCQMCACVRTAH